MEIQYTAPLGTEKYLSIVLGKHSETSIILPSIKDCVKVQ